MTKTKQENSSPTKNYEFTRSFKNKFAELKSQVNIETPDIIGLSETWLKWYRNEYENEFSLKGYSMLNNDRIIKKGDGVLLCIKDNFKPTLRPKILFKLSLNQN